jgi:hypothetical protein
MWTVRRVHCMRTLLAILFTPPPPPPHSHRSRARGPQADEQPVTTAGREGRNNTRVLKLPPHTAAGREGRTWTSRPSQHAQQGAKAATIIALLHFPFTLQQGARGRSD